MKAGQPAVSVMGMISLTRRALALPAGVVALATAALAAQALIAAPAQSAAVRRPAAGTGGWRVVKTISVHDKTVILLNLAVVSAKDAWATGVVVSDRNSTFGLLLEHWDGTAWHRVAEPAKLARHVARQDLFASVGASSASNVWVFSLDGRYLRRVRDHWAFGRVPGIKPGRTFVESVKVFSPADVWVFGAEAVGAASNLKFSPYAARFDGHRWTAISVPGNGPLGPVSAISARNMWAIAGGEQLLIEGPPASGSIVHWNGTTWQKVARQPKLPRQTILSGILARSNSNVWVGGGTQGANGSSEMAWHWNGSAWASRSPHAPANGQQYFLSSFVPTSDGMWALGLNLSGVSRVWRYSGAWSAPVPLRWNLFQLAGVPHTKTVWGIGENEAMNNGVIVLHGPLPR
jgi:hypothetical protein